MTSDTRNWREMCEALGAFWRDAGVDLAFADDARDWLAESAAPPASASALPARPVSAPAPRAPLGPTGASAPVLDAGREGWPRTLDAFAPWWLAEPALDTGPAGQRVPPRGAASPPLMVIVAEPEGQDRERLLSGPGGALFDAIERAMGLAPDTAYRASALPRHTPAADWEGLAKAGMGEVLRHHVALVAPERLLVLSREALALLKPDRFDDDGTGAVIAGDREIPLLAAYPLAQMASRPGYKRIFWNRWLAFAKPA